MPPFGKVLKTLAIACAMVLTALIAVTVIATDLVAKPRKGAAHAGDDVLILKLPPAQPAPGPAKFFTINGVLAKLDRQARGEKLIADGPVRLASLTPSDPVTDTPSLKIPGPVIGTEPFGLFAFRAPEGTLWRKWRGVEADMAKDKTVLTRCETDISDCPPNAAQFSRLIKAVKSKTGRARIDEANRGVNAAIRYVSDMAQYGEPDHWSSALSSFATAQGDCEDYAIAKYVALSEAGIAADDLRLVLVRDRSVREDHAVLAVRDDGRWLILDNRHSALMEDGEISSFTPLFAINHRGVQLFATPYAKRNVIDGEQTTAPASETSEWTGENVQAAVADTSTSSIGELPLYM